MQAVAGWRAALGRCDCAGARVEFQPLAARELRGHLACQPGCLHIFAGIDNHSDYNPARSFVQTVFTQTRRPGVVKK